MYTTNLRLCSNELLSSMFIMFAAKLFRLPLPLPPSPEEEAKYPIPYIIDFLLSGKIHVPKRRQDLCLNALGTVRLIIMNIPPKISGLTSIR